MATEGSAQKQSRPDVTPEDFERLLEWLDRDRDNAGHKYEQIRVRLIKIFNCRGCIDAEHLADETFNRVSRKIQQVAPTYVGNPALYFYGVADNIYREYVKKRSALPEPAPVSAHEDEARYECLEECMEHLSPQNRELILAYYGDEGRAKIDKRQDLATRLGIGANALWIRTHRIRESLRVCVSKCFTRKHAEKDGSSIGPRKGYA